MVMQNKYTTHQEEREEVKKVYTELEETERMKKGTRAEQILSQSHERNETIDHEIPTT